MKKHFIIPLFLVLVTLLMASCAGIFSNNENYEEDYYEENDYSSDNGNARDSLLINSISFNLGAREYETQYVYPVKEMTFDGSFSNESKESFKKNRYVISETLVEEGEQLCLSGYTAGDIYITVGEKEFDLRPKAVDMGDTFIIYGYRHFFKDGVELVLSTDKLYNVIRECPKELITIDYIYK